MAQISSRHNYLISVLTESMLSNDEMPMYNPNKLLEHRGYFM